jgi:hypothetical protein
VIGLAELSNWKARETKRHLCRLQVGGSALVFEHGNSTSALHVSGRERIHFAIFIGFCEVDPLAEDHPSASDTPPQSSR